MSPLCEKKQLCDVVKFVAALLVVNGHLFLFGNDAPPVARFFNVGAYCVSLFFFFSGYGLTYSYRTKGKAYLADFFSKRLVRVILPLVMAYAVTLPVYALLKGPVEPATVVGTLVWGGPYLKFSWYVTEIVVVYLLFYAAMILPLRYEAKLHVLTVMIVALMALLFVGRQAIWYIESLPAFVVGIWYQNYEGRILSRLSRRRLLTAAAVLTGLWLVSWQWDLCGGRLLTQYRYAFVSMFVGNAAFPMAVATALLVSKLPPPTGITA